MIEQPVGEAALYLLMDVQPQYDDAFTRYSNDIHHPETMEVEGLLSLRRFEQLFTDDSRALRILTLYQLRDAGAVSSEAYRKHLQTYTKVPEEILRGSSFARALLQAVSPVLPGAGGSVQPGRQPIGSAALSVLVRGDGEQLSRWLIETVAPQACRQPGVLSARLFAAAELTDVLRYLLQIEVQEEGDAETVAAAVRSLPRPAGVESLGCAAYRQVFPREGTLLRDGKVSTTAS